MSTTNRLLLTMNTLLALILVLVLVQALPTPASAASSIVTACANKKTGVLRLAKPACTSRETKVKWGITGPAGKAGTTGTLNTQSISYYTPNPFSCGLGIDYVTEVGMSSYVNPLSVSKSYSTGAVTDVRWNTYPSITRTETENLRCKTITVYVP